MYRLKQILLLAGDGALGYLALYAAVCIRTAALDSDQFGRLIMPMAGLFLVAALLLFVVGCYDVGRAFSWRQLVQKFTTVTAIWFGIGAVYFYIAASVSLVTPKTILALTGLIGFTASFAWHALFNRFVAGRILNRTVAFVGMSEVAKTLVDYLRRHPALGYEVTGVVASAEVIANVTAYDSLTALFSKTKTSTLILATDTPSATLAPELYQALFRSISVLTAGDLYEKIFGRVPPEVFSDAWFITNLREQEKKAYDRFRILFDYAAAAFVGMVFAFTFPIIALAIKLNSKGPIFLRQGRVGRLGRPFTVIKYRTMQALASDGSAELSGPQFTGTHDARITSVGKILRLARLDELPQFMNILAGEMALIGPRPERPGFVAELTSAMPYYQLRLLVKPGLTGWAQIHQSYFGTIQENLHKLEYDIYYIKNRGFLMDLAIVLRTIHVIGSLGGR